MNIHEYQAKEILRKFGVAIQKGIVADTPDKAVIAAKELQSETGSKWFVVKSQIHAGGRGKGTIKETGSRGVVLSKSLEEVFDKSKAILGGTLVTHQTGPSGKKVNKVLIAEDVYYPGAAEPRTLLARLLVKRGDLGRAAREFEAALKIQPDDASAAYQLALVYQKTGATRRAEELFAKVGKARAEHPSQMVPSNLIQIIREESR